MKKLVLNLALACLLVTLFSFSYYSQHDLSGIWTFYIKDAPEGYNDGTIEFLEKEGLLQGEMNTGNHSFKMDNLKISNDTITYDLTVSSHVLQAVLIKVKDSLAGKIITPQGDLVITGNRKL